MKADLLKWDGTRTASLAQIYAAAFEWSAALRLCHDDAVSVAASWLVKHHTERAALSPKQVQQLLDAQRAEGPRDAILHLVQSLDRVDLAGCRLDHAARLLAGLTVHDAPFVRAWSLSAFAKIAVASPDYSVDARAMIAQAEQTETKASVLARIRAAKRLLDQS